MMNNTLSYNRRGDIYFFKYGLYFIFYKRKSILGNKIFFPGFYYWTYENGLIGPFHSLNIAMSNKLDYISR